MRDATSNRVAEDVDDLVCDLIVALRTYEPKGMDERRMIERYVKAIIETCSGPSFTVSASGSVKLND